MKKLLVVSGLLLSFSAVANTVDTAEELFSLRGEDANNAKKAAQIYGDLAAASTDKGEKANLLYRQSEAIYYTGTKAKTKKEKKAIFKKGYEVAEQGVNLLEGNVDDFEQEETLAQALFFYGANLGKYGEAKGVLASLSRVPELKKAMNKIVDMGQEDAAEYGANRILGRLYFKLPGFAGGDMDKSEELLAEAVENTLSDDADVSIHGLNNLYYAETLIENEKVDQACELLKEFVVQDPETLLETRIPETKEEMEEARKIIKDKC